MKKIHLTTALALAVALATTARSAAGEEDEREFSASVLEAIREFNERADAAPNEVLVVLDPPEDGEPPDDDGETPPDEETGAEESGEIDEVVASILGDDEPEPGDAETTGADTGEEPPPDAPQGPQVRVQSLRDASGAEIQAEDIDISTPFPAKPLSNPPAGWKLVASAEAAEYTEKVEVAPDTWLTLSIRPHVLMPEADGRSSFHIAEPGFDAALGYRQQSTVSSSISSSIRQLEHDARVLGEVLDELEQILISLPRPANMESVNEE